jgi:hypothetical protein
VHLDRGYDHGVTRALLDDLRFTGAIARKGLLAPVQAGTRWVIERTHACTYGFGKLRRCTAKAKAWSTSPCSWRRPSWSPAV